MKRSAIARTSGKGRKTSRQDALFRQLIVARDHSCVVSTRGPCLGGYEVAHVKPKGKWPELRHEPMNACLMCHHHHLWAHREPSGFKAWFRQAYPERAFLINL